MSECQQVSQAKLRPKDGATNCGRQYARLLFLLLYAVSHVAFSAGQSPEAKSVFDSIRSRVTVDVLRKWYVPATGLYRTTGWWNSANAITALANYSRIHHSSEFLPVFANTYNIASSSPDGVPGFLNEYYDDEGWWALAWVDVFDLTGDIRYLRTAKEIFS